MSKIKNALADYAEGMAAAVAEHVEGSPELAERIRWAIYEGYGPEVASTRREVRAIDYAIKRNKRLHKLLAV